MTTPTKLSLAHLRGDGWTVDICERWIPNGQGVGGIRRDLFGLVDLVALRDGETMGVQTTSDSNVSAHLRKMTDDDHAPALAALRAAGWTVVVHGWRKSTRDGKACKHGLGARCGCRWTLHRFVDESSGRAVTVTSIPLASLGPASDGARRDQWGRYLILPPDGDKPIGYTRATTVAETLDHGYGLPPWFAAMAVCGTMMRPGLRAQWEALLAEYDGDPWYSGPEGKKACKRLVEECAAMGGANDRREIGTALHKVTELVDRGKTPEYLSDETRADVEAYQAALAEAGITFDPDYIETTVVLDEHRVAGTVDRLKMTVPTFERPIVGDLKTGADLGYSWQSIAAQIAIYSRGEACYRQGAAPDGSEDERLPMPEVDQENGLIIWLPAGTGTCELFLVDLTAGWEAFAHSMWTREWRNRQVARPLAEGRWSGPDTLAADLAESLAALGAVHGPHLQEIDVDHPEVEFPTDAPAERPDFLTEIRGWLQGRVSVIGDLPPARADLGAAWPDDLPTPLSGADLSWEQLATIEKLLDAVERRHVIPFPPPKPEPVERVLDAFPNATIEPPKEQAT